MFIPRHWEENWHLDQPDLGKYKGQCAQDSSAHERRFEQILVKEGRTRYEASRPPEEHRMPLGFWVNKASAAARFPRG